MKRHIKDPTGCADMFVRRLPSIVLCLALMLSVLCGCGSSPASGEGGLVSSLRGGLDALGGDAVDDGFSWSEAFRQRLPQEGSTSPGVEPSTDGIKDFLPFGRTDGEKITPIVSGRFFGDTWHGDVSFGDMEYPNYRAKDFAPFAEAIEDIAHNGGTAAELDEADSTALTELYYIRTLTNIADIAYSDDPNDAAAATESMRINAVYNDAYDRYWSAMRDVALSSGADLLEEIYYDWQIEWFRSYVSDTQDAVDSYNREEELVQEYYTLISAPEPDYDGIAELFVELVGVRNDIARNAGYDSYAEYTYENYYVRNYSPEDSEGLWETVKEYFVPVMREYAYGVSLESSNLYFSDEIDCSPERILDSMAYCLPRMSEELGYAFDYMVDHGLYDIEYSESKMNSGYTVDLYYYNEPFIFNCPYNSYYDYTDMFHEFGHFVNAFYTENDLLFGAEDNDLAKLQSQGLEVMFTHFFTEIFGEGCGEIILRDELMSLVYSVIDGALYDEFQQRVYAEPKLTAEKVYEIYAGVYEDYGYSRYDGFDTAWMDISHNFDHPFYYISYSISAVSALELFVLSQEDYAAALEKYLSAAALDLELYYFTDALEEIGLGDVFDPAAGAEVAAGVMKFFG